MGSATKGRDELQEVGGGFGPDQVDRGLDDRGPGRVVVVDGRGRDFEHRCQLTDAGGGGGFVEALSASAAISPSERCVSRSRASLVIPLSNQAPRHYTDRAGHLPPRKGISTPYDSRSTIMAMPWPPPTHIDSRPMVLPLSSRPFSSVVMIRAPVIPKG